MPQKCVNTFGGYRAGAFVLVNTYSDPKLNMRYGKVVLDTGAFCDVEFIKPDGITYVYHSVFSADIVMGYRSRETKVYRRDIKANTEVIEKMEDCMKKYHIDVAMTAENFSKCDADGILILPCSQVYTTGKAQRTGKKRKPGTPTKLSFKSFRKNYKDQDEDGRVDPSDDMDDFLLGRRSFVYRMAIDMSYDAFCNLIALRYQEAKTAPIKKDWEKFFFSRTPYFRDAWVKRACTVLQLPWWKHTELAHLWDYMHPSEQRAYRTYLERKNS